MWIYFKIQVTKNIHTKTKPFSFNTTGRGQTRKFCKWQKWVNRQIVCFSLWTVGKCSRYNSCSWSRNFDQIMFTIKCLATKSWTFDFEWVLLLKINSLTVHLFLHLYVNVSSFLMNSPTSAWWNTTIDMGSTRRHSCVDLAATPKPWRLRQTASL